jgi:hypothetical protein
MHKLSTGNSLSLLRVEPLFLCHLYDRMSHVSDINPLNAELNPICHLLALLGAHHIFHVSRYRVKWVVKFLKKGVNGSEVLIILFIFV